MARPRILILGGGFGGLFTTLGLAGSADVTLVSDDNHFLFTPMLYEYLSGEVEEWHIAPKFNELLNEKDVRLINDEVATVDLEAKRVTLKRLQDPVEFDILVLSVGGITNYAGVEGAEQHTFAFRKIAHADALRRRMVDALDGIPPDLPPQDVRRELTFVIVGAGASGCELSTQLDELQHEAFTWIAHQFVTRVLGFTMGGSVCAMIGD